MQIFAKSYANHRAPALFLTGWQPCSSVAPGTWRSFLHLRLARSLGLVPAAHRVSRAAVGTSRLDSHHPPLLRLLWQGWCGVQPLLRRQHVPSKICPPGPWACPSGSLLLYWVRFEVTELPSKVENGGTVGTCERPHDPSYFPWLPIRTPGTAGPHCPGGLQCEGAHSSEEHTYLWSFSPDWTSLLSVAPNLENPLF